MATREDAHLIVQLLRWGNELGLEEALQRLFSDEFDPCTAPMDDPAIAKALFFGETVCTLVKHDLLDAELLRDMIWMDGIWARVASHARAARNKENQPSLYESFEAFARASVDGGTQT